MPAKHKAASETPNPEEQRIAADRKMIWENIKHMTVAGILTLADIKPDKNSIPPALVSELFLQKPEGVKTLHEWGIMQSKDGIHKGREMWDVCANHRGYVEQIRNRPMTSAWAIIAKNFMQAAENYHVLTQMDKSLDQDWTHWQSAAVNEISVGFPMMWDGNVLKPEVIEQVAAAKYKGLRAYIADMIRRSHRNMAWQTFMEFIEGYQLMVNFQRQEESMGKKNLQQQPRPPKPQQQQATIPQTEEETFRWV